MRPGATKHAPPSDHMSPSWVENDMAECDPPLLGAPMAFELEVGSGVLQPRAETKPRVPPRGLAASRVSEDHDCAATGRRQAKAKLRAKLN